MAERWNGGMDIILWLSFQFACNVTVLCVCLFFFAMILKFILNSTAYSEQNQDSK